MDFIPFFCNWRRAKNAGNMATAKAKHNHEKHEPHESF
jgi:hypothetical protein